MIFYLVVLFASFLQESSACAAEKEYTLEEITITSSRRDINSFNMPEVVGVVKSSDTDRTNAVTLPDALSYGAGVHIQKTNLGGGSPFIRGMTGKDVLILIDGVRFNNSTFRYGPNQYLNTIDPEMIDHVEIVHGPGSVMYGSDALGGVINIITRKPGAYGGGKLRGSLRTVFGSQDMSFLNRFDVGGKLGFLNAEGGITTRKFNDVDGGGDIGKQKHTGYGDMNWNIALSSTRGKATFGVYASQCDQQDVPRTDKFLYNNTSYMYDPQRYTFINTYYDHVRPFRGAELVRFSVSSIRQTEGVTQYTIGKTERKINRDNIDTFGLNGNAISSLGLSNTFVYGFEYYADRVSSSAYKFDSQTGKTSFRQSNFPDGSTFSSYGVYAEDRFDHFRRVTATIGLRYSGFHTKSDLPDYGLFEDRVGDFTWSGSLSWLVTETFRANVKISRGFRTPNLDDTVVLSRETGVGIDIPSTDLKPISVMDYEVILKARKKNLEGDIAFYYMNYDGLIAREKAPYKGSMYLDNNENGIFDSGDEPYWKRVNIGNAFIWGVEHSLSTSYREFTMRETLTYTFGEDTDSNQPIRRIPPLKAYVGIGRELTAKLDAELVFRLASRQDRLSLEDKEDNRIPEGGTAGYAVIDIRSSLKASDNASLYCVLENLTNQEYKEHGSGIWGPGRGIRVGIRIGAR